MGPAYRLTYGMLGEEEEEETGGRVAQVKVGGWRPQVPWVLPAAGALRNPGFGERQHTGRRGLQTWRDNQVHQ